MRLADAARPIANALRKELPGSRVHFNGSLAHSDGLTPADRHRPQPIVIAEAKHTHAPGKTRPATWWTAPPTPSAAS